jgi:hypothetical protein
MDGTAGADLVHSDRDRAFGFLSGPKAAFDAARKSNGSWSGHTTISAGNPDADMTAQETATGWTGHWDFTGTRDAFVTVKGDLATVEMDSGYADFTVELTPGLSTAAQIATINTAVTTDILDD